VFKSFCEFQIFVKNIILSSVIKLDLLINLIYRIRFTEGFRSLFIQIIRFLVINQIHYEVMAKIWKISCCNKKTSDYLKNILNSLVFLYIWKNLAFHLIDKPRT
jgi:hypothetical protein